MDSLRFRFSDFFRGRVSELKRLLPSLPDPIFVTPLAKELGPVLPYLTGDILNAGCGRVDLRALLNPTQVSSLENCDCSVQPQSSFFLCDLKNVPRAAMSYDSILCNAVLEHTEDPEAVMGELHRLLRPGGTMVLTVPFLQPFHSSPHDYTRYTRLGLTSLAERHKFQVVEINSCHSFFQMVGWVFWESLRERRRYLLLLLMWIPLRLGSWLSRFERSDQRRNASAFQAVLKRRP